MLVFRIVSMIDDESNPVQIVDAFVEPHLA